MAKFKLDIDGILGYIDLHGVEGLDNDRLDKIEAFLLDCNRNMNNLDAVQVDDSIYDALYSALKQRKPESGVFNDIWEEDGEISDYTDLLVKNPMMSIETAKSYSCEELLKFIARVPETSSYFASYKINGHGIRVVYENGDLVSATSRARSSAGRDLTRHLRVLLGEHNDALEDYGLVELRGEICLKINKLEEARVYNSAIKSPFSAVASLIKPSATDEEIQLLDFLCYGLIMDGFEYDSRDDEFQEIESAGFKVPENLLIEEINRGDLMATIIDIISSFEESYEEFGYFCDGVVLEVNDRNTFREMGTEGNHNLGNIALKVGVWEQSMYAGYIREIKWKRGKSKFSPVAVVSEEPESTEGVLTVQGNRVVNVPLYSPKNIIILDAYPDNYINFRYGGEAGVVPCFADGRLLKEDAVKDMLVNDGGWAGWNEAQE